MNDGGPAFPVLHSIDKDALQAHDGSPEHRINHVGFGMSLRDWFAGMALQGLLGILNSLDKEKVLNSRNAAMEELFAQSSYDMADAMIKWRDKQ